MTPPNIIIYSNEEEHWVDKPIDITPPTTVTPPANTTPPATITPPAGNSPTANITPPLDQPAHVVEDLVIKPNDVVDLVIHSKQPNKPAAALGSKSDTSVLSRPSYFYPKPKPAPIITNDIGNNTTPSKTITPKSPLSTASPIVPKPTTAPKSPSLPRFYYPAKPADPAKPAEPKTLDNKSSPLVKPRAEAKPLFPKPTEVKSYDKPSEPIEIVAQSLDLIIKPQAQNNSPPQSQDYDKPSTQEEAAASILELVQSEETEEITHDVIDLGVIVSVT